MTEHTKHMIDATAFLASLATLADYINHIAGLLLTVAGLCWYGIRFYEWYKGKKDGNERNNDLDS